MIKKSVLQNSYSIKRQLPINFNNITGKEKFIKEDYAYKTTYLLEITNAYVSPYGMVIKNWRILKESLYSMIINKSFHLSFFKKLLLGKVRRIDGACAVGTDGYANNYYHFTAESLPRFFALKQYLGDVSNINVLINKELPTFCKEYLNIIGYERVVLVQPDELMLAKSVLLPMHTADGLCHNEELIRNMASFLKEKANYLKAKFSQYKNVYIARSKANYRKILNEIEITDLLVEYNFKIVNFEDYTLLEQVALMSNVKNCVAIHGAGLTNIMYMPKGGLVINLIHEDHYDQAFYSLSSAVNLNFVLIQGKAARQDPRGFAYDNFSIDISQINDYMVSYLKD